MLNIFICMKNHTAATTSDYLLVFFGAQEKRRQCLEGKPLDTAGGECKLGGAAVSEALPRSTAKSRNLVRPAGNLVQIVQK